MVKIDPSPPARRSAFAFADARRRRYVAEAEAHFRLLEKMPILDRIKSEVSYYTGQGLKLKLPGEPFESPVPIIAPPPPPPITKSRQEYLNRRARAIIKALDQMGLRSKIPAETGLSLIALNEIHRTERAVTPDELENLEIMLQKSKLKPPLPLAAAGRDLPKIASAPSALMQTGGNEAQQLIRELGRAGMDELAVARATGLSVPLLVRIRRGEIDPSPEILGKLRAVKA